MAIRYAVQNGNWNDPATWDGGTSVPGPDDVVVANGYTVTINVSPITVQRLSTIAEGDAPNNGGSFQLNLSTHSITADVVSGIVCPVDKNVSLTVNGNVEGNSYGSGISRGANYAIYCVVNGNVYTSSGSYSGINLWGSGGNSPSTIIVNGSVYGFSSNTTNPTIIASYDGGMASDVSITVNGSVFGNYSPVVYGYSYTGNATITINGNVNGSLAPSTAATIQAISASSKSATLTISGSVVSNTVTALYIKSNYSTLSISGNIDVNASASAITANGSGIIEVMGYIKCANSGPVIQVPTTYTLRHSGNLIYSTISGSSDGANPFLGGRIKFRNRDTTYTDYAEMDSSWNATGNYVRQYGSALALQGFPDTGDVRQGIQYGPTNEYTGTCAVPNPGTVLIGVPVDDTVGTAAINSVAVANAVWNTDHASYIPFSLPLINFGNALATMINCGILRETANGSTTSVINLDGPVPTGLENSYIVFVSGPLKGQSRKIVSVVSGETSGSVSIEPSLSSAPSSGEIVWILGRRG